MLAKLRAVCGAMKSTIMYLLEPSLGHEIECEWRSWENESSECYLKGFSPCFLCCADFKALACMHSEQVNTSTALACMLSCSHHTKGARTWEQQPTIVGRGTLTAPSQLPKYCLPWQLTPPFTPAHTCCHHYIYIYTLKYHYQATTYCSLLNTEHWFMFISTDSSSSEHDRHQLS
jgi:hypothetical protein